MTLTSSVMRESISNFRLYCCSQKIQMLRKKVKLLLEQLQVCIFAEIVFGVRCTLTLRQCLGLKGEKAPCYSIIVCYLVDFTVSLVTTKMFDHPQ